MSRSIHTNRQTLRHEQKYQFREDEIKESRLKHIREELKNKRLLKKGKRLSRKLADISFEINALIDPATIPIQTIDNNEYIHYLVTYRDLIEVAKRLPMNVMAGVTSISLCLGKEYQDENYADSIDSQDRDPYMGRICYEEVGPVYSPPIMGMYRPANSRIFIFGYVYDRKEMKIEEFESFLRLNVLSTFVHEVAHHDDEMRRSGRGRWLGLTEWRCENYAELQQDVWVKTVVIPYLLKKYPQEYEQLINWVVMHGGVEISIDAIAGEPRIRPAGGLIWLGYGINSAVEDMLKNAARGMSHRDIMFEFARDLHIGDHYEECLQSLATLLESYPNDSAALGEKADTLVHLERYDEAEIAARACLTIDPRNLDALQAFCDIYLVRNEWESLVQVSSLGIMESKTDRLMQRNFLERNLVASLYLGNFLTASQDAEALPSNNDRWVQRKKAFIALIALCSGETGKAIRISKDVLAEKRVVGPAKAILKAVLNKINKELRLNEANYDLTDYEKSLLASRKIDELISGLKVEAKET